jgi:hypothetical protein
MLHSAHDSEDSDSLLSVRGLGALCGLLSVVVFPSCGADNIAGSVKSTQGGAVIRRGTETIPAREGMHLLANDILQTEQDGRLGLILQDGTGIGLGPNTELKIDTFIYDPSAGKFGLLLRLAKGVMAYFSGKIAKFAPGSVTVETPAAVIGLRGTHMALSVEGT